MNRTFVACALVVMALASAVKLVMFREISAAQYDALADNAAVAPEGWKNEVRRALIDADSITELKYRRLMADLPTDDHLEFSRTDHGTRDEARHGLVRSLVFKD